MRKLLSCQMSRVKKDTGRSRSCAEASISGRAPALRFRCSRPEWQLPRDQGERPCQDENGSANNALPTSIHSEFVGSCSGLPSSVARPCPPLARVAPLSPLPAHPIGSKIPAVRSVRRCEF
jgi:hypothetical protein